MTKYNLRIPENLQICMQVNENNNGLVVQFHPNLWAIFRKKADNPNEYGFQLLNPNQGIEERGEITWGLSHSQCDRLINKLIKNPGYGFGKTKEELTVTISKLINKINKTYVQ